MLEIFKKLRTLRAFQKRHMPFLQSCEDFDIVREIGFHQYSKAPLTLKLLFLRDIGSVATVQRRLRRLKKLDVVRQKRTAHDRRNLELTLSPAICGVYRRIGRLLLKPRCKKVLHRDERPLRRRHPVHGK